MVKIKSVNEIILNMIDHFNTTIPDADTKPGTVIRNLIIDGPSNQLSLLYDELAQVSNLQSLRLVSGSDLDNLAKNYGAIRKQSTSSSGTVILTFASIPATVNINKNDLVYASNGFSFSVLNGFSINPAQTNYYASIASKYRNDLDFVGISDQYAVEVTVQATTPGSAGNISKYSINRTNISGVSNATNAVDFAGGSNQETDSVFRNRVLSLFSGSSIGTSLGYRNTALSTDGVIDSYIVQPGDVLMSRDGTITSTDSSGNISIVSEGVGGKVDVIVYGQNLTQHIDTFIYQDKSNNNDPTNVKNNLVLGQIAADLNKTINKKRVDNITSGTLPAQPVQSIVQVSGSLSGSNFLPMSVDSYGRITGNYQLLKDSGSYAGSPWGFDSFKWISNKVSGFQEDRVKGQFNGQDQLSFSGVLNISAAQQNISITNENSNVSIADRSIIQLLHTPATNITRVFNSNTGERYVIKNQNVDNTGTTNTTGRIQISGNTLPSASDVLQVDYTWVVNYDQYMDYDGKVNTSNSRSAVDSVDWGYSNLIKNERVLFTANSTSTLFTGITTHPVSSVISANLFTEVMGTVSQITSGIYAGRLSVNISNLLVPVSTVDNVFRANTYNELYSTAQLDGVFINSSIVVGLTLQYASNIILPTDTTAVVGETVSVIVNSTDMFNVVGSTGSINSNQLTIPAANFNTTAQNIYLNVSYSATVQDLFSSGITSIPMSRAGNGYFTTNSNGFTNYNFGNILRKENQNVQQNLSLQYYVEVSTSSLDALVKDGYSVYAIVRLSDFKELWNVDHIGSVKTNSITNNYQFILSGYNSPATGDKVLVLYYANDIKRFQPFTYANSLINNNITTLQYNVVNNTFSAPIISFTVQSGLKFQLLEPNSDISYAYALDGYINAVSGMSATFSSLSFNFSSIVNITSKKLRIYDGGNTSGTYDIISYNSSTNILTIKNNLSDLTNRQFSVIRLSDGKELWSDSGTIDLVNNQLVFTASANANALDSVMVLYYKYNNLKQSPTRFIVNVSDQVVNSGVLSFNGTTITKADSVVFTATSTGLRQNILAAIKTALGLSTNSTIPSNIRLAKIVKLENVNTVSITSSEVLSINSSYNLKNTTIKDNIYFTDSLCNLSLDVFDFILPSTSNNIANAPKLGDRLRITFYYATSNDYENVSFVKNGTLYTNKTFASLDKVYVSSGFNTSQSSRITCSFFNQPISGSRYKSTYDYTAPKQNERIVITYNYNKLIADTTFNIESSRIINADVLVKSARSILVDINMSVVISSQYITSSALVLQNLKDKITSSINSDVLGGVIDQSDLVNAAYSVSGVDRIRITYFNISGNAGQVLSLSANNDQYFSANNVVITQETR